MKGLETFFFKKKSFGLMKQIQMGLKSVVNQKKQFNTF
jgi:hypothetical protein